ncbi:MAG TPA: hypothetical protein VF384_16055 [Planctomycetota bacterium]
MHPILDLTLLTALACSVAAQVEPPAERFAKLREDLERTAIAQLRSDDLATAAWGAYAVAEFRLAGCRAEVRARLARLAGRTDAEADRCAAIALLDALIETNAVVPAAELAPFADLGAPAIVLMAREPEANRAALLRGFGPPGPWMNDQRHACGNLLAGLRDPDFVLLLLRGPWQRCVFVADAGTQPDHDLDLSELVSGYSCGHMPVPAGFPRLARSQLSTGSSPGCVLVAPGPEPVFLHRSWFHDGLHGSRWSGYGALRNARAAWLEQMLGDKQRAAILAIEQPATIEWKDRKALDEYVQQASRAMEPAWRALVQALVDAKLLTAEQAKEPVPVLQFEFADGRTDQTVALPPSPNEFK